MVPLRTTPDYQIVDQTTGIECEAPQPRRNAVEEAMRLIEKPAGHSIIIYPQDWESRIDEVYVGTRISEDFPSETDSYRFLIKPVNN